MTPPHIFRTNAPAPPPDAPPTKSTIWRAAPWLIVLFALGLRLWGIGWALPNATRLFSFHPDESVVVGASLRVNPFLLLLDPGFYNYGALPLLLNGAVIHLGEAMGLVALSPAPGVPSAGALLAARLVTAFLGALTCAFLYHTGRFLYGYRAGLAAALLYGVAPLAVQHGHFATVDVPATFFLTGALFFAARRLSPVDARSRDLLWCGVWSGLAGAAKYNALLVVLAGVAAWLIAHRRDTTSPAPNNGGASDKEGRAIPGSILAPPLLGAGGAASLLFGALAGFLAGCPTILLNPTGTLAAIAFEARHVRTGHDIVFAQTPPGFVYHLTYNLPWGMGLPLTLVALVATGYAVWRRRPGDLVLLAFALPYYILIGLAQVKFARYTLPLFPPLFLLAGALIPSPAPRRKAAPITFAIGAAGAFALVFSLALDAAMLRSDPRDQAAAYIRTSGAKSVGFAKGPWYYSPTLAPLLGAPVPALAQRSALDASAPDLIPAAVPAATADGGMTLHPVEWDTALLTQTNPDVVALSEYEYVYAQRIKQPEAIAYLANVEKRYKRRRVFSQPVQVFGLPFTKLNTNQGLPAQNLPDDMLYVNPTIVLYEK